MKLKFKLLTPVIALGAVCSFLISSCSNADVDPYVDTNYSEMTATVTFWENLYDEDGAAGPEHTMMNNIIKEFNKVYPNITIKLEDKGRYWDIDEAISGVLSTPDKLPSMAVCYPDYVVGYLDSGNVLNMDPYMSNSTYGLGVKPKTGSTTEVEKDSTTAKDDLNSAFLKEGQEYIEKGTYSLPWYKNSEALFYNVDALDQYLGKGNYDLTNWEDIIDAGRKLLAMDNIVTDISAWDDAAKDYVVKPHTVTWEKGKVTPIGYDSTDNLYITFSEMMHVPYGGNEDENGDGKLSKSEAVKFYSEGSGANEKAVQMVKMLKSWYDEGLITTSSIIDPEGDEGVWNYYTYNQECFIYVNGSKNAWYGSANYFRGEALPTPVIDDGMLEATPTVKNKTAKSKAMSQGANIVFFNKSKVENIAAWLFYKFMTNSMNSASTAVTMSSMPVRATSYDEDAITAITEANVSLPEEPNQNDNYNYLQKEVYEIYEEYDTNEQTFIAPVSQFSDATRSAVKSLLENVFKSTANGDALDTYIEEQFKAAWDAI